MNLYLIGYRGSGKTTVAQRVAESLGWPCHDTDQMIQRDTGRTITEIITRDGLPAFRRLEAALIGQVAEHRGSVVALGGGAVLDAENRQRLRSTGKTVWLQASPEAIHQRLAGDPQTPHQRPPLQGGDAFDEVRSMLAQRRDLYAAAADWSVDTDPMTAAEVAQRIAQWFGTLTQGRLPRGSASA